MWTRWPLDEKCFPYKPQMFIAIHQIDFLTNGSSSGLQLYTYRGKGYPLLLPSDPSAGVGKGSIFLPLERLQTVCRGWVSANGSCFSELLSGFLLALPGPRSSKALQLLPCSWKEDVCPAPLISKHKIRTRTYSIGSTLHCTWEETLCGGNDAYWNEIKRKASHQEKVTEVLCTLA